jgi:hypothetical protein
MSSPAAAVAALDNRQDKLAPEEEDTDFRPFIYESAEDQTDDGQPTPPIEAAETILPDSDRRRLRDLRWMAEDLHRPGRDTKLDGCVELVSDLLKQGFNPIVWCRLEQREGRVDRYGQTSPVVKTIRYFSPDSAIDGIVLDVLLNKARDSQGARNLCSSSGGK